MTTTSASTTAAAPVRSDTGADHAFLLLRTVFTVAPIVFGLDKFAGLLTDWEKYLAPWVDEGALALATLAAGRRQARG